MQAHPLPHLGQGQALDCTPTKYLQLALGLDVRAVSGEGCQAATVQLADELIQLDSAAELGAAEQLAGAVLGELLGLVDAGLSQAGRTAWLRASSVTRIVRLARQRLSSSSRRRAISEGIERPPRRSIRPAPSSRSSASAITMRFFCLLAPNAS